MALSATVSPVGASTSALPNLDSIIRGLLYLYIFSLPFKRLLFIERNGFIILIVLLVLLCVVNRRHFFLRTPIDLPLLAFIAWVGFTVPFATFPAYSFKEFAKLLQQGLIFYTVVYFFREEIHRRRLAWMLVGLLPVIGFYGIWQFLTDVLPHARMGDLSVIESVLPGEVWLTTYLVMLIPIALAMALYEKERPAKMILWAGVCLGVLCQILTFSRAGFLALAVEAMAVGIVVTQGRWKRSLALVVLLSAGLGTGLLLQAQVAKETGPSFFSERKLNTSNLTARWNVWAYGLSKIPERPLVGFGYGKDNFHMVFGEETTRLHVQGHHEMPAGTHNVFVDLAVGVGPVGAALFIWLLGAVGRVAYRGFRLRTNRFEMAVSLGVFLLVVGTVVRNSFDHFLVGSMAVLFWVLAALALAAKEHQQ